MLQQKIINKSKELGFALLGFSEPLPFTLEAEYLQNWLNNNYNAEMSFFRKNILQRFDIKKLFPEVKTVIVAAINYYPLPEFEINDSRLKISKYAWGKDYHIVIKEKLLKLAEYIEELIPASKSLCYVDSGNIMEKQWAVRAGIGWQGKNSLVINKEFGSFIFLGIILSTAEFDFTAPVQNLCGDCTLCIDKCPTNAIISPGQINANKCISYWTIESKAEQIPADISAKLNNWVYGCDICQEICPWNKKAKLSEEISFQKENNFLNFEKLQNINENNFNQIFSESAIKRLKYKRLKRNIETVLQINQRKSDERTS